MSNIMRYRDYYATVCYEDETSTFYGQIEDIEDLVSFEADTVEGLKKEFAKNVNEYLELCKRHNKEPNKPYKGSFNVRVGPSLHKEAVMFAKTMTMSLNQFVMSAIKDKIEDIKKQKQKV